MFERDYIMKLLADLLQAIVKSMLQAEKEENPYLAAQTLEAAIGNAVDMDASVFMSLSPESMASIMTISHTDPRSTEYIARSLALAADYNRKAGFAELADLRMGQARAVACAFGHDIADMEGDPQASMRDFLDAEDRA